MQTRFLNRKWIASLWDGVLWQLMNVGYGL